MTRISRTRVVSLVAISALLLAPGCAVGPNFKRPAAPKVPGYTPTPPTTTTSTPGVSGGEAQQFLNGKDIPGEWWALFHSKPLNDLIERSLNNNPDLKAAQAALLVARENVRAQRGAYYPAVTGGFSADHSKSSSEISPVTATSSLYYSRWCRLVSINVGNLFHKGSNGHNSTHRETHRPLDFARF